MEEVYRWVDQYGGNICRQLRRMGSSVDWSRQVRRHTAPADPNMRAARQARHFRGLCIAVVGTMPACNRRLCNCTCVKAARGLDYTATIHIKHSVCRCSRWTRRAARP